MLTRAGWLQGTFEIPDHVSLVDHLDYGGAFYRLFNVQLPHQTDRAKEFVLRKTETLLVIPAKNAELRLKTPPTNSATHRVSCLIKGGMATGHVDMLSHLRASDHVLHQPHFIVLRDGSVMHESGEYDGLSLVLVNGSRILGVTEAGPVDAG